jgi:hypothetical protein
MKHGGSRPGAGRKSKSEEQNLAESLYPMKDDALKALNQGIKRGDHAFIKMFFEYFYGKPTDKVDLKMDAEVDQKLTVEIIRASKDK